MLRLLLVLCLLSSPALAKPLDWRKSDCKDLPFQIQGEFACKVGKAVPANDMAFFHATRDTEKEFLRYYLMTLRGMRYFIPLSGRDLIEEFEATDPWSQGASWEMSGDIALAKKEGWSCAYRRSLHVPKQQGYRHAFYVTYCLPSGPQDKLIEAVSAPLRLR